MAHERRIFVDLEAIDTTPGGAELLVQLSESQTHHLFSVLRLNEGDPLVVVARSRPRQFRARIGSVPGRKRGARGTVVVAEEIPVEADLSRGVLLFPLCKPRSVELVCEKATELNISQIIFWQADRSVVKVGSDADQRDRQQRLATIAESAACQSGRLSIPTVRVVSALDLALELVDDCSVRLFGHLGERAQPLIGLQATSMKVNSTDRVSVGLIGKPMVPIINPAVAVGPEGDFTERELTLLAQLGFTPVTLGPTRLRSETAALAMLSWLLLSI